MNFPTASRSRDFFQAHGVYGGSVQSQDTDASFVTATWQPGSQNDRQTLPSTAFLVSQLGQSTRFQGTQHGEPRIHDEIGNVSSALSRSKCIVTDSDESVSDTTESSSIGVLVGSNEHAEIQVVAHQPSGSFSGVSDLTQDAPRQSIDAAVCEIERIPEPPVLRNCRFCREQGILYNQAQDGSYSANNWTQP